MDIRKDTGRTYFTGVCESTPPLACFRPLLAQGQAGRAKSLAAEIRDAAVLKKARGLKPGPVLATICFDWGAAVGVPRWLESIEPAP